MFIYKIRLYIYRSKQTLKTVKMKTINDYRKELEKITNDLKVVKTEKGKGAKYYYGFEIEKVIWQLEKEIEYLNKI